MQGASEAAIFLEGAGQRILLGISLELLHEERRRHPAQLDRARCAYHLVPPVENPRPIDAARQMGLEPRIALHVDGSRDKEPPVVEIPQPGSEAEAQEIKERKDDFGRYMDSQDPHSGQGRARPIAPRQPRRHACPSPLRPAAAYPAAVSGSRASPLHAVGASDTHTVPLFLVLRPFPPALGQSDSGMTNYVWPLTYHDEKHYGLFITSRQFERLLATLPREVQGFRFPTWGATDDDPPACFQQTQAVADIAFGSGERAHQLGVATRDHPACALLIPPEPGQDLFLEV